MTQLPRPIVRLANEFDANSLIVNGVWEIPDPVNGPGAGTWFIQVFRSPLTVPEDIEATQLAYNKATGRPKFRSANDGAWSEWIDAVTGEGGSLPASLQAIADLTPTKGRLMVGTGATWAALDPAEFGDFIISDPNAPNGIDWFSMSDLGLNLVTAATVSDAHTELGLVIGTDVQGFDADLTAITELAKTKGNFIVANGASWVALAAGVAGQYLTPNASTVSGYEWADLPASGSVDLSDYYTKEQTDAAFQPISSLLSGLATLGLGTNTQILSTDGSTFKWIDTPAGVDLSNYYTKTQADAAFQAKGSYLVAADLDPYLTSATASSTYVTFTSLSDYLTTADAATTYQPIAATLTALSGKTISAFAYTLLDDANSAAARATLGAAIGTDVQAWSANLDDWSALATTTLTTSAIEFVIDGGGSAITPGIKGELRIPFNCTIVEASITADQATTTVVDIWKDSYANFPPADADSITASTPLTITSGLKNTDTVLTSWVKSITAGDYLRFNVDSNNNAQRVTIYLKVIKT